MSETRWCTFSSIFLIITLAMIIRIDGQTTTTTNGYDQNQQGLLGGLVDVDVHNTRNGGKHVGVHVPIFYNMDLDKEPGRRNLGISVLDGLIKVRVAKDPYQRRKHKGLLVALADIPLWASR